MSGRKRNSVEKSAKLLDIQLMRIVEVMSLENNLDFEEPKIMNVTYTLNRNVVIPYKKMIPFNYPSN